MNGILANNATKLAPSLNGEASWDFDASANRAAKRDSKGVTRERAMLIRQKLVDLCKGDYRTHFASIYGKTDRLPAEVFENIEKAVDKVIGENLAKINPANVVSFRRGFAFKSNDLAVVDRLTLVGENFLTLAEQHLGINIMIDAQNKRLTDLESKPTPDLDREKAVKAMIAKMEVAKSFIEGEQAHQKTLENKPS